MTEKILSTVATVTRELNSSKRNVEKLGALARGLRWHRQWDDQDLAALLALGKLAQDKRGAGCWLVEQAVLEILCDRAERDHVPFLSETFRRKTPGQHSNDRRRLALQALSGLAARTGDDLALYLLEEGLAHHKKDTRGWAIGFLMDAYLGLKRPLPPSAIDRLQFLVDTDISPDVRVEAVTALANLGLVDQYRVDAVITTARQNLNGSGEHTH